MHATAIDDPTTEPEGETRRIDVTDVETAQVAAYAADRESVRFERRGGWTYLVEER